jgi:hypothetical protein
VCARVGAGVGRVEAEGVGLKVGKMEVAGLKTRLAERQTRVGPGPVLEAHQMEEAGVRRVRRAGGREGLWTRREYGGTSGGW